MEYGRKQERARLLLEVARLYWNERLSQETIAQKLHFSRSRVSRLLSEARRSGFVKVLVVTPRTFNLENEFIQKFNLEKAVVVEPRLNALAAIAEAGAELICELITPRMVIALSNGVTLSVVLERLSTSFKKRKRSDVIVAQMIGALEAANRLLDGYELCNDLADFLGGTSHSLPAPLILQNPQSVRLLTQEPILSTTLALASHADMALVGIGMVSDKSLGKIFSGWASVPEANRIHRAGAVGHLAAQFYDLNGQTVHTEFDGRTLAISLSEIRKIPRTVALAHGRDKAKAILGALRGGYIDILVTDADAAEAVLVQADKL